MAARLKDKYQKEVRKKIQDDRAAVARKEYLEGVRKKTTVWTAYDDPATAPSFATRPTDKAKR